MPQTPPAEDFSSSVPKTCSPTPPSLDFCRPCDPARVLVSHGLCEVAMQWKQTCFVFCP